MTVKQGFNRVQFCMISECPVTFHKPDLNETTAVCHTSASCTGINCCVYVPLLDRTFDVFLDVDSCYGKLSVGIEKMYKNKSFLGYQGGQMEMFSLQNAVRLE